jgi:hypothetical protein
LDAVQVPGEEAVLDGADVAELHITLRLRGNVESRIGRRRFIPDVIGMRHHDHVVDHVGRGGIGLVDDEAGRTVDTDIAVAVLVEVADIEPVGAPVRLGRIAQGIFRRAGRKIHIETDEAGAVGAGRAVEIGIDHRQVADAAVDHAEETGRGDRAIGLLRIVRTVVEVVEVEGRVFLRIAHKRGLDQPRVADAIKIAAGNDNGRRVILPNIYLGRMCIRQIPRAEIGDAVTPPLRTDSQ